MAPRAQVGVPIDPMDDASVNYERARKREREHEQAARRTSHGPTHHHHHHGGRLAIIVTAGVVCLFIFLIVGVALTSTTVDADDDTDTHVIYVPAPVAPATAALRSPDDTFVFRTNQVPPQQQQQYQPSEAQPHTREVARVAPPTCPPSEIPEIDRVTGAPTGACRSQIHAPNGTHAAMVDLRADPRANYYRYASGAWLDAVPAGSSRFFGFAAQANEATLADVLDVSEANTWSPTPLGQFIRSCLAHYSSWQADADAARAHEAAQIAAIDDDVAQLAALVPIVVPTSSGTTSVFDVLAATARWHQIGYASPLAMAGVNSPVAMRRLVWLVEAPAADPLEFVDPSQRVALVQLILRDFDVLGTPADPATSTFANQATAVVKLCAMLVSSANNDYANVNMREYVARYYTTHAFSRTELQRQTPHLRWDSLAHEMAETSGLTDTQSAAFASASTSNDYWIWDTQQLATLDAAVRQFSITEWRAFFAFIARLSVLDQLPHLFPSGPENSGLSSQATGSSSASASASASTDTLSGTVSSPSMRNSVTAHVRRPDHHAGTHVGLPAEHTTSPRPHNHHPAWRSHRVRAWPGLSNLLSAAKTSRIVDGVAAAGGPSITSSQTYGSAEPSGAFSTLEPHEIARRAARDYCESQAALYVPELLDETFTRAVLTDIKQAQVRKIVTDVRDGVAAFYANAGFISRAGRQAIATKLASVRIRVGTPVYRDSLAGGPYGAVMLNENYCANTRKVRMAASRFALLRTIVPFDVWQDSSPFGMPSHVVNAYCDPREQTISILSGITTKPFDGNTVQPYSDASLLAGLGAIVGHELEHLLDANGRMFDDGGALTVWLSVADARPLVELDEWIIEAYAVKLPFTNELARSRLQVGEAAADIIGLHAAYLALVRRTGGAPSPASIAEFCLFYAQMWATAEDARTVAAKNAADPHPIPEVRVVKAISTLPAWSLLYGKMLPTNRPRLLRQ